MQNQKYKKCNFWQRLISKRLETWFQRLLSTFLNYKIVPLFENSSCASINILNHRIYENIYIAFKTTRKPPPCFLQLDLFNICLQSSSFLSITAHASLVLCFLSFYEIITMNLSWNLLTLISVIFSHLWCLPVYFIYICMYMCVCMWLFMCMCLCVSMCEYMCAHMYMCEWAFLPSRNIGSNVCKILWYSVAENAFVIFYLVVNIRTHLLVIFYF